MAYMVKPKCGLVRRRVIREPMRMASLTYCNAAIEVCILCGMCHLEWIGASAARFGALGDVGSVSGRHGYANRAHQRFSMSDAVGDICRF